MRRLVRNKLVRNAETRWKYWLSAVAEDANAVI